jgi:drug/metabolite transporter (DMT)-like permease
MYMFRYPQEDKAERLTRSDLPYTIGMVALDVLAPILLMLGIKTGTSSAASLLGNFEIVATSMIALLLFKETVSRRLWLAVLLITASSLLLSFDGGEGLRLSLGSAFVLAATICWGLENNCTRKISEKSTYQIVTIKGICSGLSSLLIAFAAGEPFPAAKYIALTLFLGYVAYGLSIFTYIRAQRELGAAKTSAYYAVTPFIGAFLSFALLHEPLSGKFLSALALMLAGTGVVVYDTLKHRHEHTHEHVYIHTHNGITHRHVVVHSHKHSHYFWMNRHGHHHALSELEHAPSLRADAETEN